MPRNSPNKIEQIQNRQLPILCTPEVLRSHAPVYWGRVSFTLENRTEFYQLLEMTGSSCNGDNELQFHSRGWIRNCHFYRNLCGTKISIKWQTSPLKEALSRIRLTKKELIEIKNSQIQKMGFFPTFFIRLLWFFKGLSKTTVLCRMISKYWQMQQHYKYKAFSMLWSYPFSILGEKTRTTKKRSQ